MQKKLTAAVIAGAVVLGGGAAIAVPAFAASGDSTTSSAPASRVDAIKNALKGLVDDKTLTQAQADKVAEALGKQGAVPGGGFSHHGFGMGGSGLLQDGIDAAAKVLGMSADDVRLALRSGSTLSDLAKKQGKSETAVIDALVAVAKTHLADAVKSGHLTQAQSNEIQKNLPDQVKQMIENGRGFGRGPGMGGPGRGGFGPGRSGFGPGPEGGTSPAPAPSGSTSSTSFQPASSI